ncbi:MAG: hypothetical protein HYU61_11630 [Brevundimonas diminuta]|jgi:7-keto-8-aminopelargonate synthetase-like enzyme|uniref:Uncharacterized protein n=1 Tax=Brevundimonas vancanneytii TaxID=1325724 RepID=A0A4P1JXH8_9CAUL|nr:MULTISPECIES: hypothetical protein [Brevundimonas]MBI2250401.1 hypothetical protein [Brevundimonas diminuta]VTO13028.1 Uncharacterised protein [Brevundimonas vancanneytii]HCQ53762.1 hypothetical protein [Brevundimonas diminuta]
MSAPDQEKLNNDAARTLKTLLHAGIKEVDAAFGSGYAYSNPALVAGYLQAGATLIAQQQRSASLHDNASASSGDE